MSGLPIKEALNGLILKPAGKRSGTGTGGTENTAGEASAGSEA